MHFRKEDRRLQGYTSEGKKKSQSLAYPKAEEKKGEHRSEGKGGKSRQFYILQKEEVSPDIKTSQRGACLNTKRRKGGAPYLMKRGGRLFASRGRRGKKQSIREATPQREAFYPREGKEVRNLFEKRKRKKKERVSFI